MVGLLNKGRSVAFLFVKSSVKKNCGTVHCARFRLVFERVHFAGLSETNKIKK
jgi:hypothetical protein